MLKVANNTCLRSLLQMNTESLSRESFPSPTLIRPWYDNRECQTNLWAWYGLAHRGAIPYDGTCLCDLAYCCCQHCDFVNRIPGFCDYFLVVEIEICSGEELLELVGLATCRQSNERRWTAQWMRLFWIWLLEALCILHSDPGSFHQ